jgi:hypothetical protein
VEGDAQPEVDAGESPGAPDSENLWGRDVRTLYNLKKSDAEEFFGIVNRLELKVGASLFGRSELERYLVEEAADQIVCQLNEQGFFIRN